MRIAILILALSILIYYFSLPNHPTRQDLYNKNIVITGCSSGIGKELAKQYASYGANLILTARRLDLLEETAKICHELGAKDVKIIKTDLSNKDDVSKFSEFVKKNFKSEIDILLLNHALSIEALLISKTDEEAEKDLRNVFDINFFSFAKLTKNLLNNMREGSSIVAVSSQVGVRAMPFLTEYSSSKHAMQGFFDALRHELSLINRDVSVTIFPLGPIKTEILLSKNFSLSGAMETTDCAREMIAAIHNKVREAALPRWTGFVSTLGNLIPELMDEIVNAYFIPSVDRYTTLINQYNQHQKRVVGSYFLEDFKDIVSNVKSSVSIQTLTVAAGHYMAVFLLIFVLHIIVPGRVIDGYACDSKGKPLRYKLNGLTVSLLVTVLLFAVHHYQLFDATYFAVNIWPFCISGFAIGMSFCAYLHIKGVMTPYAKLEKTKRTHLVSDFSINDKKTPSHLGVNDPTKNNFWFNFFTGYEFNPRFTILGNIFDYKMFGYLFGAVVLEIILISNMLLYQKEHGVIPLRLIAYTLVFSFWLNEYLFFENVHLYTFDFICERVGFKLTFGCLVFYPFFYPLGTFFVSKAAFEQGDFDLFYCLVCAAVFFVGWILSRGSNLQKFYFKVSPTSKFFGFIAPKTVGGHLLVSGFWSLSRHINYLGEIVMSVGLCMLSRTFAWLYVIYYVGLLFSREREDNELCARKYGQNWEIYCQRVPWRIIPFIY